MKLNNISGWRAKWLILAVFWTVGVLTYKNNVTNGLLLSSIEFDLWYPVIKASVIPVVAMYFCIDLYRYALRPSKNQLT